LGGLAPPPGPPYLRLWKYAYFSCIYDGINKREW